MTSSSTISEVQTRVCVTLMAPEVQNVDVSVWAAVTGLIVTVQPQHWDLSSSNKTGGWQPRFSQAEAYTVKKSKRHSCSFLQPVSFVLVFYGCCREARCCQDPGWENPVSRPREATFGHPSIHSLVPDNTVSQRRFQSTSARAGERCAHQRRRLIG